MVKGGGGENQDTPSSAERGGNSARIGNIDEEVGMQGGREGGSLLYFDLPKKRGERENSKGRHPKSSMYVKGWEKRKKTESFWVRKSRTEKRNVAGRGKVIE